MATGGDSRPQVVIVGGGFGGLNTALALRKAPVRVTLVDRTNHHLFQPLLYQVATAGLSPADIATPIRSVVGRQPNTEVLMGEVTGVDTADRRVLLGDGRSLAYDYLVLAPGSRYIYFGHDEWAPVAPTLKTIEDATAIRRRILLAFEQAEAAADPTQQKALLTFVLIGAGPTGVEMAGAIAELAHKALARDFRRIDPHSACILLLEAGPRVMGGFPEELSAAAAGALRDLGVEIRTGARVEHIDEQGVVVGGQRVDAATVLWCAGVAANPAGQWIGAETDRGGRVKVGLDLSVPGHPEIFVIGDAALVNNADGKSLPGLAPVAMQQGRYVAGAIRHRLTGQTPEPFRYRDKGSLATVGRVFAVADFGKLRFSGFFAWLLWAIVHIFYLIDYENRILVMMQWFWAYVTFRRGARLIVGKEKSAVSSPNAELPNPAVPKA